MDVIEKSGIEVVNLTPHEIQLRTNAPGEKPGMVIIPPDPRGPVRVNTTFEKAAETPFCVIHENARSLDRDEGLMGFLTDPPDKPTFVIVARIVYQLLDRKGLLPNFSSVNVFPCYPSRFIRDGMGRIIGSKALVI